MKVYSAAQIHALDRAAEAAGIGPAELMGRAADGVAAALGRRFPGARRALVLCGPGNNGGDGYGVAARLLAGGVAVDVLETTDQPGTPEARSERAAFTAAGGACARLTAATLTAALATTPPPELVVDALFGVGLRRALAGELAAVVAVLNAARSSDLDAVASPDAAPACDRGAAATGRLSVVSIDVPSGIDADSAAVNGPHVRADLTVELAGHKLASLCHPAMAAYGERVLVDIGIPAELLEAGSDTLLVDGGTAGAWLPDRETDVNKYSAGTVCIVAGSSPYLGAAELACRGAWRGGAGLVTLVAPARFPGGWPETVVLEWNGDEWPPPRLSARQAGAVVFGPGLAVAAAAMLPEVLAWAPAGVVIDASGLEPGVLAACVERGLLGPAPPTEQGQEVAARAGARVLTPHAGEAARILATSAAEVAAQPLTAAREISRRYSCVCVLKGPTTVIAEPSGRAALSTFGHPGMAAGGTGDVLAGLLGALLADPAASDAFETVAAGVAAHGLAGESAARRKGRSLTASDLAEAMPRALRRLSHGRW